MQETERHTQASEEAAFASQVKVCSEPYDIKKRGCFICTPRYKLVVAAAENVSYLDILVDDACLSLEKLRSAIINHPFADPAVVGNAMRELLASGIYYHIERLEQYRQEGSCYRLSCLNESGVYPPSTVFNTLATLHIAAEAVSASLWAGRVSAIAMEEDIAVVEKCMNRVHEAFSLHLGACREKEGIYKAQISNCSIVAILLATVAFSYLVQLPGGLNTKGVSAAYATGGSIRAAFVVFVFFNSSGLVVSLYCVLYPATIGPWVTHQYYKQAERMCHCLYLASSALFAAYLAAVYIAFGVHDFGHFFSSIYIVLFGGGVLFTLILLRRGVVKRLRSFWDVANNPGCLRRFRPVNDQYRNWAGL